MYKLALTATGIGVLTLAACNFPIGNGSNGNAGSTATAPAQPKHYVNDRSRATTPLLRENYVDFSFDYPERWTMTPQGNAGTDGNFVRVAAPAVNGFEPFAVHFGTFAGSGDAEADRRNMEAGAPQFAGQFGSSLSNYQLVSVGPSTVGPYRAYGWRFTATAPGPNGGPTVRIFGRGDFVLPPGATHGLTIVSLVTDRTTETQSAQQVGESGTLKAVFDSLQIGGAPNAGN
jgi:hypothetical protein